MNQKIVIGNWKNYLNYEESILLSKAISNISISDKTRVMISPNHLYLKEVNEILNKTNVEVIAQNLTSSNSSSDTGGITAVNLRNLNVNRSIIAHSEARIRQKNPQDVLNEIIPMGFQFVLCFEEIDQIPFDLLSNDFEIILAYEPVWAIGTGETASIDHINEIHEQVKSNLKDLQLNIPVLYGGSVNPSNSKDILESEFVDGVLVGGASTKIDQLEGILNSI
ncbi:MAG: triosephosphate isomerase [Flavobacteriaceae bacterium]|nr:triosephosphate isomerase [Flavobacteriaceae bacterium]MBL6678208.1 triosephosphate isomerase [Flavobacteriaceae bacterium]